MPKNNKTDLILIWFGIVSTLLFAWTLSGIVATLVGNMP